DRRTLAPLRGLRVGEEATAVGDVKSVQQKRAGRRGRPVLEVVVADADALLLLVWFHQIQWFARRLSVGQRVVVHGKVEAPFGSGVPRIIHPEVEVLARDEQEPVTPRVVPVYEKPTEMHVGTIRRIVHAALAEYAERVPSALPPEVAARQRVIDL